MGKNFLKLNEAKTKLMVFKPNADRDGYSTNSFCLNQGDTTIETENIVKLLGVMLEPSLSFAEFINKKIRTCNFHLHNLKPVKNLYQW